MGQVNVNPGTERVVERDSGAGIGMIVGLLLGLVLLALVAWWAFTQSGWFGPVPGGTTNVNVTTNNPPGGSTTGGSSTGSTTGGTTSGSTSGSTTGSTTGR
jgi:hypothetical protein